ncbi:Group II intron-encoded protein ltrA [Edwardsiella tarda]|nr:Group II intron-encoded protein ltrA [Edwardsiella tarda]
MQLQVLQPLIDPILSDFSYGLRPDCSSHNAVLQAQESFRGDLEKFFDRVYHDILMGRLVKQISDEAMLQQIRRYL